MRKQISLHWTVRVQQEDTETHRQTVEFTFGWFKAFKAFRGIELVMNFPYLSMLLLNYFHRGPLMAKE